MEYLCGEEGHYARDCTKEKKNVKRVAMFENLGIPEDYDVMSVQPGDDDSDAIYSVAIDSATPVDDAGPSGNFMMDNAEPYGGGYGPMRTYGRMYGSLDFDDWGYGMGGGRPSRTDTRPDLVRNLICILVDQRRFDAGLKITSLTPA
ncbi:hypothetical protein TEA_012396 [Camellia sinensis var. sinensis]|uniref:CCHC-type domain-containing protein n=1 Tax=Camellia sinensis var. sinensis TaxID=542762 RepID=A0A4S4DBX5_CAMSN|nr:hypothetical protein TEA_012396 [Camellia sinensis var. sinensis]